jgi:hypothetical protein
MKQQVKGKIEPVSIWSIKNMKLQTQAQKRKISSTLPLKDPKSPTEAQYAKPTYGYKEEKELV